MKLFDFIVLFIIVSLYGCIGTDSYRYLHDLNQTAPIPNISSSDYQLMDAARSGDYNAAKTLISQGANVNAIDDRLAHRADWSVLIYAIENGHDDIAELLVENGANVTLGIPVVWHGATGNATFVSDNTPL